jgi:uncharacterized membrane protein
MKSQTNFLKAATVSVFATLSASAQLATYTFESLTNGALAGQDGWIGYADVTVRPGNGVNTTKVMGGSAASRERNPAFNAPSFNATETDAVRGFDFRVVNTNLASGGGVSLSTVDHLWAAGEGPVGLHYSSTFNHLLVTLGNGASYAGGANNFPHIPGHWYRFEMRLNFTAYTGNGSASVFYMDLTAGDTNWHAVAMLQNLGLGLANQGVTVDAWDRLDLRAANVELDNIVLGTTGGATSPSLTTNASFEAPNIVDGSVMQNPTLASWSFLGTAGIVDAPSAYQCPTPADGEQAAFLKGAVSGPVPQFSQYFSVAAAGFYRLRFLVAGAPEGAGGLHGHLHYLAKVDGTTVWSAWTHNSQPFMLVTLDFHAAAGSHSLVFQTDGLAPQSDSGVAFFDHVRVQPSPPFTAPTNPPTYHVTELPLPAVIAADAVTGGEVVALNELGQAAGNAFAGSVAQALRWSAGTNQFLGSLPGQSSQARGMNADGHVVGASGVQAVIWQATTALALDTPGGDTSATAADIDDAGAIIGTSTNASGVTHLVTWAGFDGAALIQGAEPSTGAARRNNGDLVGDGPRETGSPEVGALYFDGAEWRHLLVGQTISSAVNESGTVCGSEIETQGTPQTRAWKATVGTLTYLPHLCSSTNSTAEDLNNAGDVVGISQNKAVLWRGTTVIDLNTRIAPDSGCVLQKATVINNRGQIAGVGTRNGQPRIFLLSPGPLPNLAWSWSDPRHTHAHLAWNTIPGFGYAVESSTDLTIWTSRARFTATADSSALDLPAHPGVDAEFWRVLFTPFHP